MASNESRPLCGVCLMQGAGSGMLTGCAGAAAGRAAAVRVAGTCLGRQSGHLVLFKIPGVPRPQKPKFFCLFRLNIFARKGAADQVCAGRGALAAVRVCAGGVWMVRRAVALRLQARLRAHDLGGLPDELLMHDDHGGSQTETIMIFVLQKLSIIIFWYFLGCAALLSVGNPVERTKLERNERGASAGDEESLRLVCSVRLLFCSQTSIVTITQWIPLLSQQTPQTETASTGSAAFASALSLLSLFFFFFFIINELTRDAAAHCGGARDRERACARLHDAVVPERRHLQPGAERPGQRDGRLLPLSARLSRRHLRECRLPWYEAKKRKKKEERI